MLKSEKTQTKEERHALELIIKDKLYETFFLQRDMDMVYPYLNQLCQNSIFQLAQEDSTLSPYAVEFLLDLKETIMSIAIMTGETKGITAFDHQNILKRFLDNVKQIEKTKRE